MKPSLSVNALILSLASLGTATSVTSKGSSKLFGIGQSVSTSEEASQHINITKTGNVLSYVHTMLSALTTTESNIT
jgi:phage-related tail fiber protein